MEKAEAEKVQVVKAAEGTAANVACICPSPSSQTHHSNASCIANA